MGLCQESKTPATMDCLIHQTSYQHRLTWVDYREIVKYKIPTNFNKTMQVIT